MGSHATPPTQPLTYHVGPTRLRDISVRIRFGQKKHGRFGQKHGLTKYRRFGQNVFNMLTESDIIGRGFTE